MNDGQTYVLKTAADGLYIAPDLTLTNSNDVLGALVFRVTVTAPVPPDTASSSFGLSTIVGNQDIQLIGSAATLGPVKGDFFNFAALTTTETAMHLFKSNLSLNVNTTKTRVVAGPNTDFAAIWMFESVSGQNPPPTPLPPTGDGILYSALNNPDTTANLTLFNGATDWRLDGTASVWSTSAAPLTFQFEAISALNNGSPVEFGDTVLLRAGGAAVYWKSVATGGLTFDFDLSATGGRPDQKYHWTIGGGGTGALTKSSTFTLLHSPADSLGVSGQVGANVVHGAPVTLAFAASGTPPTPPPTAQKFAILVGGQSNAAAWNNLTGQTPDFQFGVDNVIIPGVKMINAFGFPVDAVCPVPTGDAAPISPSAVSFSYHFCKFLKPLMRPQDELWIVNMAVGNTSVAAQANGSWNPASFAFPNHYTSAKNKYVNAVNQHGLIPAAFLWHQGESDCSNEYDATADNGVNANYAQELYGNGTSVFQSVRRDVPNATNMPILVGPLFDNIYKFNGVNAAIKSTHVNVGNVAAGGIANAAFVSDMVTQVTGPLVEAAHSDPGLPNPISGKPLHINAAGHRKMGALYAQKFLTLTHPISLG
jgi:hypothetical protein